MADQGTATDRKSPLHQAVPVSSATQEVVKTQKADAAPAVAAAVVEEGRAKDAVDEDIYKPPHLTYFQVFVLFIKFGKRQRPVSLAHLDLLRNTLPSTTE